MPKQRKRRGSQWQPLKKPAPGDGVVIGYVRYSSINQDPRSIAEQKVRIEQKVATYGWRVARFAEEPEESASYDDLDSRPVFKSLLLDDAGQTCNVIMCDESSRWARSEEIGYMSLRILREKGCWWETASDDWDINKPLSEGGSIMWGIALSQNASYSRKMSYHSRKGKMAKAREGYSNGTPIYGYHTPALPIEPTATVQDLQRMRRRIVYEPHPVHFAGLQKIGELAAQQHPILWHSAIANELNRLRIPYHIQRGIRDEWTPVRVAMVLRSHYPREFVAGGGKGTIQLPDGEDVEGLHVAAWPFEQWQHIVENQRIAGGRPPRNKQSNIAPLQNLLTCSHCGHTLRYRDTVQRKRDVTHLYSYYVCLDRLTDPCPAHEGRRHGLWIPVPAVHQQFRHLLELFGMWLPDALEYMKAEYARSDAGEVESVLEYQAKKAQLASRKKKIDDMYELNAIDRAEYLRRLDQLRRDEATLPTPISVGKGFDHQLRMAGEIASIATRWEQLSGNPGLRYELAHILFNPQGVLYDPLEGYIVGVRPAPDFYDLFKQILGRLGWIEQEPGLLWNAKAVGKTYRRRSIRFPEIIDFLKAAAGPITRNDVIERLGVTPSSAFRTLSVLAKDGLVRVTHHREGAHHWDTYAWVESSAPIPFRHPRSRGSGTFHHS